MIFHKIFHIFKGCQHSATASYIPAEKLNTNASTIPCTFVRLVSLSDIETVMILNALTLWNITSRTFNGSIRNECLSFTENISRFIRDEAVKLIKRLGDCEQSQEKIENDGTLIETVLKYGDKT